MKTAEEFLKQKESPYNGEYWNNILIEFAKLHVTEALKQASEKGYSLDWRNAKCEIDKQSILNSYPLTLIK